MTTLNGLQPFVIAQARELCGRPVAFIVGVEIAIDEHDAFCRAQRRWTDQVILAPKDWGSVSAKRRLTAIQQDWDPNSSESLILKSAVPIQNWQT